MTGNIQILRSGWTKDANQGDNLRMAETPVKYNGYKHLSDDVRKPGQVSRRYDCAPQIRAAFMASLKEAQWRTGKTLPELMCDWLLEDPVKMLTAISRFQVRESKVDVTRRTVASESISETMDFIRTIISEQSQSDTKEPSKD